MKIVMHRLLSGFIALFLVFTLSSCHHVQVGRYVNPIIGTAAHGHTFPGATVPFGMVQISPDTHTEGWDWCSGYHYSDSSIMGFSHTHLSGTGRGDLLDILFMPFSGPVQWEPGSRDNSNSGYRSKFSHKNEVAVPGFYSVLLDDDGIKVELTATTRCGFHKYTFAKNKKEQVIIDLLHSLKTDSVLGATFTVINDTTVIGSRKSRGWGERGEKYWVEHEVFFAAVFSKPIKKVLILKNDSVITDVKNAVTARIVKAVVEFDKTGNVPLLIKVGISNTDTDGALKNLKAEISGWDFAAIKHDAWENWNRYLSKVTVNDKNEQDKTTFYTALYHSLLSPYTYCDVDHSYIGFDGKRHTPSNINYTGLSLWDTFRANNPMFTILAPNITKDIISTMLAQYDEYGLLPVWPLCSSETNCMIGYHAAPIIIDAYLKGISGFDIEKAYKAMLKSAHQEDFGISCMDKYGYLPADLENKSVSKTLEYAFDDWCITQLAKKLGKTADYEYFMKRSEAYKKVYDPGTGFMRGRRLDGTLVEPFDPTYSSYQKCDYVEGNAWQYSWFVPQDIPSLISLMGGAEKFTKKLDDLFTVETSGNTGKPLDISGLIGEYAHGNEPSHHVAYLYSMAGHPEKTQQRINQIMTTLYSDKPDGLCGNEDMGQMSGWYIFSAMGFYPVNPCDGKYIFGTPQFSELILNLDNGKHFVIKAKNLSKQNIYIKEVLLNGSKLSVGYITHDAIVKGGELQFIMDSKPGMVFTF